jgi:hypothetical protein
MALQTVAGDRANVNVVVEDGCWHCRRRPRLDTRRWCYNCSRWEPMSRDVAKLDTILPMFAESGDIHTIILLEMTLGVG